MKKMLILVPNLNLGGQQRVAVNSAEILASDYEISIVVFDASKRVYFPECEVIDLSIPAHSKRIQKIVNVLRRVHILRKIRKSRDIFCCLSLGPSANLVNILSRGCGMSVCSWRGYQSVVKDTYLMNFINRHSDVIIGCSKVFCSTISNNNMCLARKIRCIYNPIDIERIEEKGKASVEDYSFSAHTVITKRAERELFEIPMTTMRNPIYDNLLINTVLASTPSKWRSLKVFQALNGRRTLMLRPDTRKIKLQKLLIDNLSRRNDISHIEFMVHSSEVFAGTSPHGKTNGDIDKIYQIIGDMFRSLRQYTVSMTFREWLNNS